MSFRQDCGRLWRGILCRLSQNSRLHLLVMKVRLRASLVRMRCLLLWKNVSRTCYIT